MEKHPENHQKPVGRPGTGRPFAKRENHAPSRPYAAHPEKREGERKPFAPGERSGQPARNFADRPKAAPGVRPMGERVPGKLMAQGQRSAAVKPMRPAPVAKSNANARLVALNVLCDVTENGAFASLALDERLSSVNLNQLDRRFCASLVYRTIENLNYLDYALNQFLTDPDALDPKVRNILRTAACQIMLHDRVPDSAAVNEAVNLTKVMKLDFCSGLVNAVLHKLVANKENIAWPNPGEGARYLSIMYTVPEWLAERLIEDYGRETAEKIVSFRTEKHFLTIRPTFGREAEFKQAIEKKIWETEKGNVPGALRVYGAMQIGKDRDFLNGVYSIQGEGSMLAAEAICPRPGMNILDCCAAPGGKTAYIAEKMGGAGRVFAWDVHEHRVDLIRAVVQRLHLENVRASVRDALVLRDDMVEQMDAVLLDAPCSGVGVMDDKPDVKRRQTEESLNELVETQEKLLETCCRYVRKGGTLVYSTCSLMKDENERQVARFLRNHPEFRLDVLPETIPENLRAQQGEFGLQLLPFRDGVEGFFMARMKRI